MKQSVDNRGPSREQVFAYHNHLSAGAIIHFFPTPKSQAKVEKIAIMPPPGIRPSMRQMLIGNPELWIKVADRLDGVCHASPNSKMWRRLICIFHLHVLRNMPCFMHDATMIITQKRLYGLRFDSIFAPPFH
jgi:hypothetical protein